MGQNVDLNKGILELLGLTHLPKEKQIEMISKMTELVQRRAILRVIENLDEDDSEEAKKVFAQGNPEKTLDFIVEKYPNFNEILKEEVNNFKKEMVENISKVEL